VPPVVLAMVAVAALAHAAWNVLIKTSGDPLTTSGRAMVAATVAGLPVAAAAWLLSGRPGVPLEALALGVVSGLLEVAYFVLLTGAYRRGELSLVYPIARGTGPLLAIGAGVLVLGEPLGPTGAAGVAALVVGMLLLQRPWRLLRRGRVAEAAVPWAIACGVSIAAYSAVDRVGVRLVAPWIFAAIMYPVAAVGLAAWVRFVARPSPGARVTSWRRSAIAGFLVIGGYGLILAAYAIAPLSVVAPLRESAVVIVAGWGSFRMGESTGRGDAAARLAGALCVAAGAVILAAQP